MLEIQQLRTGLDTVTLQLAKRGYAFPVEAFNALEAERKKVQTDTQELQAQRNSASKRIGHAKSKGEDVSAIMAEVAGDRAAVRRQTVILALQGVLERCV